jgi:hypothetical protein
MPGALLEAFAEECLIAIEMHEPHLRLPRAQAMR